MKLMEKSEPPFAFLDRCLLSQTAVTLLRNSAAWIRMLFAATSGCRDGVRQLESALKAIFRTSKRWVASLVILQLCVI